MNITMKYGNVIIDGKSFSGRNISINGNKVVIDGATQDGDLVGDISVVVNGDIEKLELSSGTVSCGVAGSVKTQSGSVKCSGSIGGSVQTMSGSVSAGLIHGSVSTMSGSISGVN